MGVGQGGVECAAFDVLAKAFQFCGYALNRLIVTRIGAAFPPSRDAVAAERNLHDIDLRDRRSRDTKGRSGRKASPLNIQRKFHVFSVVMWPIGRR